MGLWDICFWTLCHYEHCFDNGINLPSRCSKAFGNCTADNSATKPYIVAHHLLLSHAAAVQRYHEKYQEYAFSPPAQVIELGSAEPREAIVQAVCVAYGFVCCVWSHSHKLLAHHGVFMRRKGMVGYSSPVEPGIMEDLGLNVAEIKAT